MSGVAVSQMRTGDRTVDGVVRADEADRRGLDGLDIWCSPRRMGVPFLSAA